MNILPNKKQGFTGKTKNFIIKVAHLIKLAPVCHLCLDELKLLLLLSSPAKPETFFLLLLLLHVWLPVPFILQHMFVADQVIWTKRSIIQPI